MEKSTNLSDLPRAILTPLFNMLDEKSLHNMKIVCKRFYTFSNEFIFSRKLEALKIEHLDPKKCSKKLCEHYSKIYTCIAKSFNLKFTEKEHLFHIKQVIDLQISYLWKRAFSDLSDHWFYQIDKKEELVHQIICNKVAPLLSADVKAFTQWQMFDGKIKKDYMLEAIHFKCEPQILRQMMQQGARIEFYHIQEAIRNYNDSFIIELIDAVNCSEPMLVAEDIHSDRSLKEFLADPMAKEKLLIRTIDDSFPYTTFNGKNEVVHVHVPHSEELLVKLINKIGENGTQFSLGMIHKILSSHGIRNVDTILFHLLNNVDTKLDEHSENNQHPHQLKKICNWLLSNYACLDQYSSLSPLLEKMKIKFPNFFKTDFFECINNDQQPLRKEKAFIALIQFLEPKKIDSNTFCWALFENWSVESIIKLLPLIDKEWLSSKALEHAFREKPSVELIKVLLEFGCTPSKENLTMALTGVNYVDKQLRENSKACNEIVISLLDTMKSGDFHGDRCLQAALKDKRSDEILIKIIDKLEKIGLDILHLAKEQNRSKEIIELISQKVQGDLGDSFCVVL